jgi:preprotein translocase subunit SecG
MFTFLIVVITLIGALMVLVILLQSGKGGGLSGMMPGNATRDVLGARQAPDVLERATWTLGTAFIVLCMLTSFVSGTEQQQSVIQQRSQQPSQQNEPAAPLGGGGQGGGGQGQQAPGGGQQQAPGGGGGGGQPQQAPTPLPGTGGGGGGGQQQQGNQ